MSVVRAISVALQAHLDGPATTTTRLLKITTKSGVEFGLTTLDQNVTYDDGATSSGALTYIATNGFDPQTFSADTGFSVGNSEAQALISDEIPGVTLAMVEGGEFDDATWICYLVNFKDLSMGHVILDAGDVGQVTTKFGMLWIPELLSYVCRLKQPIGGVWSLRCRAEFGTPAASQTGCGVDVTSYWVYGTVSSVGAESDRQFTGSAIQDSSGIPAYPGRVQFLTGDNAGREFSTEVVSSLTVTLAESTNYAISIGDTYRIRPDCLKRYTEDCIGIWNNGPNFKGEPLIPLGDSAEVLTPSAQTAKKQPKFKPA